MTTYFMFGSYSVDAVKKISAERTKKAAELIEEHGGKLEVGYALLGEYDIVLIVDLPGTEQAMETSVALTELLGITRQGRPLPSPTPPELADPWLVIRIEGRFQPEPGPPGYVPWPWSLDAGIEGHRASDHHLLTFAVAEFTHVPMRQIHCPHSLDGPAYNLLVVRGELARPVGVGVTAQGDQGIGGQDTHVHALGQHDAQTPGQFPWLQRTDVLAHK